MSAGGVAGALGASSFFLLSALTPLTSKKTASVISDHDSCGIIADFLLRDEHISYLFQRAVCLFGCDVK